MAKSNALRKFKMAFAAGERSDKTLHECLIEEACHFAEHSHDTNGFTKMVEFMLASNPDGFRCKGIIAWLKAVVNLEVSDKGKVTAHKRTEYGREWLDNCKANPWYTGIQAEFTVPGIGIKSMAARLVVRQHLGEEPDWDAIMTSLQADYSTLLNKPTDKLSEKLKASDAAVKAGKVKRLDVEEDNTPPVVSQAIDGEQVAQSAAA